jgi:hypothetical protein
MQRLATGPHSSIQHTKRHARTIDGPEGITALQEKLGTQRHAHGVNNCSPSVTRLKRSFHGLSVIMSACVLQMHHATSAGWKHTFSAESALNGKGMRVENMAIKKEV